jgi:hypothetical protein
MQKRLGFILALFLFSIARSSFGSDSPLPLHPKPHDGYEIKDGKIYFRHGEAGLILEVATPDKIQKYYKERGSEIANPFEKLGGEIENATIFLVTLLNRTNGSLTFTPRYVLAKIKSEGYFALDYTVMLDILETQQPPMKKLLENSIFHSPEIVQPGTVVTKFLVFPQMPKKIDDLRLEFDYLYFENFEVKSTFFFTTK